MENQLAEIEMTARELDAAGALVLQLMKTPHYQRLTEVGIFSIIQKAKSLNMNIMEALNGGLFFVSGKVEMTSAAMNALIRSKGHSITKDERSTPECCILRGKRADNGDTWIASFSLVEAKRAGLNSPVWSKYPDDMLFARALSRLGRQLFPDVIKGCYVQGEIQEDFLMQDKPNKQPVVLPPLHISDEQVNALRAALDQADPEFKVTVMDYLDRQGISRDLSNFPVTMYDRLLHAATQKKLHLQEAQ